MKCLGLRIKPLFKCNDDCEIKQLRAPLNSSNLKHFKLGWILFSYKWHASIVDLFKISDEYFKQYKYSKKN